MNEAPIALISGGSSKIGRLISAWLAGSGWQVICHYHADCDCFAM